MSRSSIRVTSLLACTLVMGLMAGPAMPQPEPRPVEPARPPAIPARPPVVGVAKPPPVVLPRLPQAAGMETRTLELPDASGQHRFRVTLTASKAIDPRVLDYLARTLRIVEVTAADRADLAAWQQHPGPGGPGADVSVTMTGLGGVRAADFIALPPDGVELIRPGVLRVRDELIAGLEQRRGYQFPEPLPQRPMLAPAPPPGPGGRDLRGTLRCRAADDTSGAATARALPFVKVRAGEREATTSAAGAFTIPGDFRAGSVRIQIVYDAPVTAAGVSTPLRVMDELHRARSETVTRTARLAGGQLTAGDIQLTSVDCELWRLGADVLADYHDAVGRTPPARQLRIKRWSAVWGGTPYTYYDHIVLGTNYGAAGTARDVGRRRGTMFHEFGHSIRHVADGSEAHWGWDNFRWAYARNHRGCETFNTQYAFNEGWASYWAAERGASGAGTCSKPAAFVDWTEDMIAGRLVTLARALSADPRVRARKMVEVLERNPRTIHSLRDFELRYCALHAAGNAECTDDRRPRRPAPASCPPGYIDDGATCRLNNILAKESYGRGVGTVPTVCGSGRELDAGLCYPTCQAGYNGVGPVCWQRCPSGFRNDGAYCGKPAAYGRGAGYPWKIGDAPFDLSGARRRCEAAHAGGCEQHGLLFYPKCRSNFHAFGCCVCTPDCPAGMTDIGVSCQKRSYGRGVGTVPTRCAGGKEYDAGLCYTPCRAGFVGVGPVCWERGCPPGYADHGATCYRDPSIIVKY
jgi:hypothetical protein